MKFKIGDKVKVKSFEEIKKLPNTIIDEHDGIRGFCEDTDMLGNVITTHNSFVSPMFEFCGKETIVKQAREDCGYILADTCGWGFIASWLELKEPNDSHFIETFDEE